jgi:hypothetical protein
MAMFAKGLRQQKKPASAQKDSQDTGGMSGVVSWVARQQTNFKLPKKGKRSRELTIIERKGKTGIRD